MTERVSSGERPSIRSDAAAGRTRGAGASGGRLREGNPESGTGKAAARPRARSGFAFGGGCARVRSLARLPHRADRRERAVSRVDASAGNASRRIQETAPSRPERLYVPAGALQTLVR